MSDDFSQFDLNLFRVFVKVMQTGSYSRASEALNVSPPAISLAMGRLQEVLGQELFVRGSTTIVPTSSAQSLYRNIGEHMLSLERAYNGFENFTPNFSNYQFTLSVPEDFNPVFLESLPTANNPELTFVLQELGGEEEQVIDSLRHRTVDLVVESMLFDDKSIEREWLFDAEIVLVAAKKHPELKGRISVEQYQRLPQSVLNIRRNNQYTLNLFMENQQIQRNIAHQASSLVASMLIASRTQLFCHTTRRLANFYKDSLGLQIIEAPIELNNVPFYMMWHKSDSDSARHQWLRDRVRLAVRSL